METKSAVGAEGELCQGGRPKGRNDHEAWNSEYIVPAMSEYIVPAIREQYLSPIY